MNPDAARGTGQPDYSDLDALADVEADAAEAIAEPAELDEIDEALQEGWNEYGNEGEAEAEALEVEELEAEEAEPELTLDHLLRFEEGPEGETEADERRASRRAVPRLRRPGLTEPRTCRGSEAGRRLCLWTRSRSQRGWACRTRSQCTRGGGDMPTFLSRFAS